MSGRSPMKSPPSSSSPPTGSELGRELDSRVSEWNEWQWQEQYHCEYRSRENPVGSGKWEYDYRYPEADDTTPRSSQLDLTSGPPDFNRALSQGYSFASGMPRAYPPNSYPPAGVTSSAPYPRSEPPYNSGQATSTLSTSTGAYNLPLRPAHRPYGGSYQGSSPGPLPPLMTDSSGYPVGGPNTLAQTYSGGADDDRNYAASPFPSPYKVSSAQNRPAASPQSSDARQRSDTNESDRRITSVDSTTGNESLDPNYRVHSGKDFQFAKVFKILWAEPMGQVKGGKTKGTEIIPAKYGEDAYASIRRFVVVSAREGHCLCLPILTYGGQATKKKGVKPQDHAIVYMVHEVKGGKGKGGERVERPKEIENEQKLNKMPIRIKPLSPRDQLDHLSRLNYAKIYTVEYNVKVCFIGSVHEDSQKYFRRDYNLVHQPLPEDPDTQYSDEERELSLSPQGARLHGAVGKQEPEKRQQDSHRSREKKDHDSSRKEKRDRHSRGKGNSRS